MLQNFKLGQRVRFTETFTDLIANTLADPTVVTLKLRDPVGTETPLVYGGGQVIRDSLGVYHCDLTLSVPGKWFVRWTGTGAIVAADELQFNVTASAFTAP